MVPTGEAWGTTVCPISGVPLIPKVRGYQRPGLGRGGHRLQGCRPHLWDHPLRAGVGRGCTFQGDPLGPVTGQPESQLFLQPLLPGAPGFAACFPQLELRAGFTTVQGPVGSCDQGTDAQSPAPGSNGPQGVSSVASFPTEWL